MFAQRRRDPETLEQRRKQAARLFAKGKESQASIARLLKVSRMSVSRWHRQWRKSGDPGLKATRKLGRKPRLSAHDLKRIQTALRQGAQAHGFSTDLWTLPRVAAVIKRITNVRYHPGHVWRVLGAMEWTVQKPEKQAKERIPSRLIIGRTYAGRKLKSAIREQAWIFFQDETGFSQRPSVRRT